MAISAYQSLTLKVSVSIEVGDPVELSRRELIKNEACTPNECKFKLKLTMATYSVLLEEVQIFFFLLLCHEKQTSDFKAKVDTNQKRPQYKKLDNNNFL